MKSICFYFQIHQPFQLKTYRFFDIGHKHDYYDEPANRFHIQQLAENSYLPANKILLKLIEKHGKKFRVSFSISGIALEQLEVYAPKVIKSFQELAQTGNVEFLAETYMHSLASLKNKEEFFAQVKMHEKRIKELFGVKPKTFRNTELIYNDNIAGMVHKLGYNTMLTEGAKHILGWKSPNLLYCSASNPKVKLLLKNFQLSDDITFRFSIKEWNEWPLTADKFVTWLNDLGPKTEVVNLFMDYETFGEYQKSESGIFAFLETLPGLVLSKSNFTFQTPSQVSAALQPASPLNVPYSISWADEERDITAWLGNEMQNEALSKLYNLVPMIVQSSDEGIQRDWKNLQVSDHFYYMSTKWFSDESFKRKVNPYNSPYDAFINYMNVLVDFEIRLKKMVDQQTVQPSKATGQKKSTRGKATIKGKTVNRKSKSVTTPKKQSGETNTMKGRSSAKK